MLTASNLTALDVGNLQVQASIGAQVQKTSVVTRSCSAFKPVENPNDHWTQTSRTRRIFWTSILLGRWSHMKSIPPTFSRLSWRSFCFGGFRAFPKKGKTWPPKWIGWSIILDYDSFPFKKNHPKRWWISCVFFVPSSWPHSQWFSHEVARLSGRMKPLTLSLMTPTYRTSNFISVETVGFGIFGSSGCEITLYSHKVIICWKKYPPWK